MNEIYFCPEAIGKKSMNIEETHIIRNSYESEDIWGWCQDDLRPRGNYPGCCKINIWNKAQEPQAEEDVNVPEKLPASPCAI